MGIFYERIGVGNSAGGDLEFVSAAGGYGRELHLAAGRIANRVGYRSIREDRVHACRRATGGIRYRRRALRHRKLGAHLRRCIRPGCIRPGLYSARKEIICWAQIRWRISGYWSTRVVKGWSRNIRQQRGIRLNRRQDADQPEVSDGYFSGAGQSWKIRTGCQQRKRLW